MFTNEILPFGPELPLAREILENQEKVTDDIVNILSLGDPKFIAVAGVMAGGKSTVVANAIERISSNSPVHIFLPKSDDVPLFSRTEVPIRGQLPRSATAIHSIDDLNKDFLNANTDQRAVIWVDELQFGTTRKGQIIQLIDFAKSLNISVIATGLTTWFNGKPVEIMQHAFDLADKKYIMRGYCSFNKELYSAYSLRLREVDAVDERYRKYIEEVQQNYGVELVTPQGRFKVPAPHNSPSIMPGQEHYMPISWEHYENIHNAAGIYLPKDFPKQEDFFQSDI